VAADDLINLAKKMRVEQLRDKVFQRTFETVHVLTDERIFKKGRDANGKPLGIYSKGYQATRKRGVVYVRKGVKLKNTYPSIKKIILQATGQMNADYRFLVLPNNQFGSGFANEKNFDKSKWVEITYQKRIFSLSNQEDKKMEQTLEQEMQQYLNKL
jgi:hypothetical protein